MSDSVACDVCNKQYAYKPALAGKRVKCKCGGRVEFPARTAARSDTVDALEIVPSANGNSAFEPLESGNYGAHETHEETKPVARGAVKAAAAACTNCGAAMQAGGVICMACGCNQKTGRVMTTAVVKVPVPLARKEPVRESSAANESEPGGFLIRIAYTFAIFGILSPLMAMGGIEFKVMAIFGENSLWAALAMGIVGGIIFGMHGRLIAAGVSIVGSIGTLAIAVMSAHNSPP